jgi:hypothetical protein
VRLGSYDALAAAVLDGSGQPVSQWWPWPMRSGASTIRVRRRPLLTLLRTPGRYTAAFAAEGWRR